MHPLKHRIVAISVNLVICLFFFQVTVSAEEVRRPGWWLKDGIVFVGNWEPLSFLIRSGQVPRDYRTHYDSEHQDSTVIKLKAAGVNMVLTHFYKGLGPELEEEDLAYTRQLADNLKKHGMYAGAYIGSTLFSETMYREIPGAADLILYDHRGDPVPYWNQYYRDRADVTKRGYRDLIKSQVSKAISEYGMNLIHFDNFSYMFPLNAGYTDHLHQQFRKYLEDKYTPEQRKQRLGFSDVSLIRPPRVEEQPMKPVRDPLVQEWTTFRVDALTDYAKELYTHIRALDPEAVVEFNPHGIWGNNLAYRTGMDHGRLLPYSDAFWSEDPDHARYFPDENRLVSKIRSYKLGRHFGNALFAYNRSPLEISEALAFNRMCLGDVRWSIIEPALEKKEDRDIEVSFIRFFHENIELFRGLETIDDVGVMRGFTSMTFGGWVPFLSTVQAEQVLIQNRVPFTLLFDQDWARLPDYKVVVMAAQENLSDQEIKTVKDYVGKGGSLVVVGQSTGQYDDWRRARSGDDSFWRLMGLDEIEERPDLPARLSLGKGRIFYLPGFHNHPDIPEIDFRVNPEYWKLPLNWEEFMAGLCWVRRGEFSITVETKPWVAAAFYGKGKQRQVHLVNYWPGHPARYIPVIFTETGLKPSKATLYSPEHPVTKLDLARYRDGWAVILPEVKTYGLLVCE
ncbi:MAG: family 10 glycosylhydrolase [Candidatus Glassbacteria bacterium]|nr:family 10 glycosylhydrolase [Candidatus Glassbacteria bacterium]